MTDFEQLDEYIEYMRKHGRRETTLYGYKTNMNMVLRTLRDGGRHWRAEEIDKEDVVWLNAVLGERVTENTRNQYLSMLTRFVIHYTGRDVKKQADILFNDDSQTENTPFITKEDFARLYVHADEADRLILVLGAYMGLRRMEIARLKESDISGNTMTIHGKGHGPNGKVATMTIPKRVMEEIEAYRRFKRSYPFGAEFVHLLETAGCHQRLKGVTPGAISKRMQRLAERAGDMSFETHSLRRLYATTLYYDTHADLITVRNLMRHSKSSSTVERYIAPFRQRERDASASLEDVLCKALGEI